LFGFHLLFQLVYACNNYPDDKNQRAQEEIDILNPEKFNYAFMENFRKARFILFVEYLRTCLIYSPSTKWAVPSGQ